MEIICTEKYRLKRGEFIEKDAARSMDIRENRI
jgi:hypothetical protein